MKMGDIKSVKVDNWGVFFLQKLQNFFNKTDYCDLTLQFNDNSQLKVHRLVLNACTDYFNVLENTCEMSEDILIMPKDLQADVIVPIVNFMYTGTLEFETNMYDRLLKTARDMNMTVLLKLLEAHRKTAPIKPPPIVLNKQAGNRQTYGSLAKSTPITDKQRRTYSSSKQNLVPMPSSKGIVKKQVQLPVTYVNKTNIPEPVALVSRYSHSQTKTGPSRFEPPDESVLSYEPSFNPISYETKPLLIADSNTRDDDYEDQSDEENVVRPSTSTFEQLRKGYTNPNKRPASSATLQSPPMKKMNLQEIKEYTEQHRKRKEIEQSEEYEDDPNDYESMDESNFNEDEDDDEPIIKKEKPASKPYTTSTNNYNNKQQQLKPTQEKSTVVIKDSSGSVNHAKIISEVLKKYPHLVKNNKNIKLKIMQKNSPQQSSSNNNVRGDTASMKGSHGQQKQVVYSSKTGSKVAQQQVPSSSTPVTVKQPARIDSKTMHALIAKGPENTTGPWLCIKCGIDNRPISIPSYRSFYRHLVNTHKQKIDDRICDQCGMKSNKRVEMFYHQYVEHKIKPPINYKFPKCMDCEFIALDQDSLEKHSDDNHKSSKKQQKDIQHCIYCNKTFAKEILLYAHMRSNHKDRARDDGVMDFSDDEQTFQDENDKYIPNSDNLDQHNKIKVLSNISLPSKIPFMMEPGAQTISQIGGKQSHSTLIELQSTPNNSCKLEPSSEAEALSNVATGIATSLGLIDQSSADESQYNDNNQILPNQYIEEAMANVHGEYLGGNKKSNDDEQHVQQQQSHHIITKLVTEDGSELQLTESQKDEIMSQLQVQDGNLSENVVMVLNQDTLGNENVIVDQRETTNVNNEQNIVVVYRQEDDETNLNLDDHSVTTASGNTNASIIAVAQPMTIATEQTISEKEIKIENLDANTEKMNQKIKEETDEAITDAKAQITEIKSEKPTNADIKLNESIDDEELKNIEKAVDEFNTEINDVIESAAENNETSAPEKQSKTNGKNEDSDKYKLLSALEDWTDDEDMGDSKNSTIEKNEDIADGVDGGDDDKVVVYQHTTTTTGENDDDDDDEDEEAEEENDAEEDENVKTEDDDTKDEMDDDDVKNKNVSKEKTKSSGVEGSLVAIIDEWENESQSSDKVETAKDASQTVKAATTTKAKIVPAVSVVPSSSAQKTNKDKVKVKKVDDDDDDDEEKKVSTKKVATATPVVATATTAPTTKSSSNNEQIIKKLINDWGDDDDESEI